MHQKLRFLYTNCEKKVFLKNDAEIYGFFFLFIIFFYNHPKNLYVNIVLVCILREIVKKGGREGVVGFE